MLGNGISGAEVLVLRSSMEFFEEAEVLVVEVGRYRGGRLPKTKDLVVGETL